MDKQENNLLNINIINEKKTKYSGFRKNLQEYVTQFCKSTNMYGFRYLGEQKRFVIEKVYWLFFILISFYMCIHLMVPLLVKWSQPPVLVLVQNSKPVWQVPFPAITICPETKLRQRVYNFTDYYHRVMNYMSMGDGDGNLTTEELQKFSETSLVCDNHLYTSGNKTTNFENIRHLTDAAPPLDEVFFGCKFGSINETCHNLFSPLLTEDGLCFTFNMLDQNELFTDVNYFHDDYTGNGRFSDGWTLENGYTKNSGSETYPRRTATSGSKGGIFLLLRAYEQDLDYACRGPVQGFKVLLHDPSEVPRIASQYFRAPLNEEIVFAVKPDMITTAPSLRNYDPSQRECFFSEERYLKFFRNYTQQNCRLECLANFTLSKCGCVAYHMPREKSVDICGSGSNICMFEAERELELREADPDISDSGSENNQNCNCLPACTSITYSAETSQAKFDWPKVFQAFKANFSEFPGIQMTRLTIFFRDMQFSSSEKTELYSRTEYLANFGGLLALFTGFSFLSVAEILYFLSLRLICNIKKYGRRFWAGPTE